MAVFEVQGPDGKVYEVEAPDANTAASAFQQTAQPKQPGPSWWQRNITGMQDPAQGQLPSVYSQ